MIFKGNPNSLKESYFTGELGLGRRGGVLNLGSLNSPLHRENNQFLILISPITKAKH